jgi:phage terminase large subunit GpA-like protein
VTLLTDDKAGSATAEAIRRITEAARIRRRRTMRQFAEAEITLPTGPYQDQKFRVSRVPWTGLLLDAIDSGQWQRIAGTGPSQSGKTLVLSGLPVCYHLFECQETVIYAAPTMDMAADKWQQDIRPIIAASAFRDLLPATGRGSKGGTATSIQFKHGPTLKFMSAGGEDKKRAGFTSRVVVATEVDGMDEAGEASRESDPMSQIEARTNAFGSSARLYMECTVSTDEGRIWREIKNGTDSRLVLNCPHCRAWVSPEREHLRGWQEAKSASEAAECSSLVCPSCGTAWSEDDRMAANRAAKLAHKGQDVTPDGTVAGLLLRSNTLGFRYHAAHNPLVSMAKVAETEWSSPRVTSADAAEKKLRQFYWTLPSEPEAVTVSAMDVAAICSRSIDMPRGRIPEDTAALTVAVDVGKWLCHWGAVAWRPGGTPHVPEYGRLEVPSAAMAEEQAILTALRRFRDEVCKVGWPRIGGTSNVFPSLVLVDSGNWEAVVVAFCAESGPGYLPSKGFGIGQLAGRKIAREPGFEVRRQPAGHSLVEINADHWKSFVHARLQTPAGQPGGLTLFHGMANEHLSLAKHLTAEKKVEEFVAGRGLVTRWEAINRNNHYLDMLAMACAAGYGIGQKLDAAVAMTPAPPPQAPQRTESNRPEWMPAPPGRM